MPAELYSPAAFRPGLLQYVSQTAPAPLKGAQTEVIRAI